MNSHKLLNEEIAELIGAHVGDGTLYKTNWGLVWELRGDLKEKSYYSDNIVPLVEKIFDVSLQPKFRSGGKNGCWGVQTSNKKITSFFLEKGFNPGRKSHTVYVPEYIFSADLAIQRAFVRGLFDTDGCLCFETKNTTLHYYPRLEFGFASKRLRDTLQELVKELGFISFGWSTKQIHNKTNKLNINYRFRINGKIRLEKWMKEIQPKNPKHLNKYKIWKNLGYYNAAMAQPGTA